MRIAVFNQKGGVGKTTTALNLAAAITRRQGQALLIDLDTQAHLTFIHNTNPVPSEASIYAFYQQERTLDSLTKDWNNVGRIVPVHAELIKVDTIFGKGPHILNKLNMGLNSLQKYTTIIDCCPFLGILALTAIFAADRILVPVSSDFLSMRGGAMLIEQTLKALEPVLTRRMERRYLLTRFDHRRKMSFVVQQQMREHFGADLCETVISENVAVAEAPAQGKDIFSHAAGSRGAKDYTALLDELTVARFVPEFSE